MDKKLRISKTKKEKHGQKISSLRERLEKLLREDRLVIKAKLVAEGAEDPDQMADVLIREALGTIDFSKVTLKLRAKERDNANTG